MSLFNKLKENKGLLSSALSKKLAKEILIGNIEVLNESFKLIHNENKNIRSGAAKIIEIVAEEKPSIICNQLNDLIPCLNYEERQTRWMVLHISGLCAKLQPNISRKAFNEAVKYLDKKYGTVLNDRAITYFGYLGSISKKDCTKCFPYLIKSFSLHPNRITRIFESFERMKKQMNDDQKQILRRYVKEYLNDKKPSIRKWAKKIEKKIM